MAAEKIRGAGRRGAILGLVARASKYTVLHKLKAATAEQTARALLRGLRPYNGEEFAGRQIIPRQLGAGLCFSTPCHAWERGLNENTSGLIRQYFPKGTRRAHVPQSEVRRVQTLLNSRPRKTLAYTSPNEVSLAPRRSLSG